MNITKILKYYLIFILTITAISALSYSENVKYYFSNYSANVLNAFGISLDEGDYKYKQSKNSVLAFYADDLVKRWGRSLLKIGGNSSINFEVTADNAKAFALPGAEGAEIMKLDFKAKDKVLQVEAFNFKIVGTEAQNILKAYLFYNGQILDVADKSGEYLEFNNIALEVAAKSRAELVVKLDLAKELKTNNRFRLDIEKTEDIKIKVDGKSTVINRYYPIKGKYLTIAKARSSAGK